jgi:hypothetical protein
MNKMMFMKKVIAVALAVFVAACGYSQHLSVNAYGGYTFQDKIEFGNAYAYINAGGIWGVSVEGIGRHGSGLELLYQYQSTDIPVYKYPSGVQLNAGQTRTIISYLLLNFEQYWLPYSNVQPYGAVGLGAGFYSGDQATSSTKFAWDIKGGVKIKAGRTVGVKIGAQLLAADQATGTAFYYPGYGYPPYAFTTYATILQFSFTGGLVFDFGGRK